MSIQVSEYIFGVKYLQTLFPEDKFSPLMYYSQLFDIFFSNHLKLEIFIALFIEFLFPSNKTDIRNYLLGTTRNAMTALLDQYMLQKQKNKVTNWKLHPIRQCNILFEKSETTQIAHGMQLNYIRSIQAKEAQKVTSLDFFRVFQNEWCQKSTSSNLQESQQ